MFSAWAAHLRDGMLVRPLAVHDPAACTREGRGERAEGGAGGAPCVPSQWRGKRREKGQWRKRREDRGQRGLGEREEAVERRQERGERRERREERGERKERERREGGIHIY